ncbi:MAG: hypothetical protein ACKVT2_13115 [Saprospiraceae bacterium]
MITHKKNFATALIQRITSWKVLLFSFLFGTLMLPAQARLDLDYNNAGINLNAKAILLNPNPNCALKSLDNIGNAGLNLQPNGDYLVSDKVFIGDLSGFSCAQKGECAMFLKVHDAGSKEVVITWETIARTNFDWTNDCPCPDNVNAEGSGLTDLDVHFKIIGHPPGGAASIKYTLSQYCRVGSESEAFLEDLAEVDARVSLNYWPLYGCEVFTHTAELKEDGISNLTGTETYAIGENVSVQIFSDVFAKIRNPPRKLVSNETDNAWAESYGSIKLELTTTTNTEEAFRQSLLSAPVLTPNPASGKTSVIWQQEDVAEVSISVVDMLGKSTTEIACGLRLPGSYREDITLADLGPGIYLLQMRHKSREGVRQTVPQRLVIVE